MAYPIQLQAMPESWYLQTTRKADDAFRSFNTRVFERDDYTCQYCGFQAREYQEVVNLDHNYRNNKLSNLVTACCFCAQCFFIESVGVGNYGGGTLVYLPEISQNELNSLCHVLFCAITNDTGYKNSAQSIYRSFKFRSQLVEDKYGEGTSNPAILGLLLIDLRVELEKKNAMLEHCRLLPSRAKFRRQIERWAELALDELASEEACVDIEEDME